VRPDRVSVLVFDDTDRMRFVAWRGLSDAYRAAVDGHSPWTPDTVDPRPVLVENVATSDLGGLRSVVEAEGIAALAFFPLVFRGVLLGKFMLYYDRPHTFTPDETRLAATVGQHVAFGLSRVVSDEAIEAAISRERIARQEADTARREAEAANEAKDEFLAMLGHELRNPLAAIVTSAAVLEASAVEPVMRRSVATISRQATHLARLTNDLLDVARITRRQIELERQPVDLRTIASLAWEAQRHQVEARSQQVTLGLPNRPVMVWGDPVRLQQVVGNLINNASKYSPAGSAIGVNVETVRGEAVVEVSDSGIGIPPDKIGAIFDLFFQANATLARTEGGLGIGLTLARRVVQMHGGTIEARSGGTGQGSTFSVRLPQALGLEPVEPARQQPAPALTRSVLLIEDHEDGREALATLLRRLGHDVQQASTGTAGVEAATRYRPDVAVVDIGLPDIDGYEVGRLIRKALGRDVFLVALTGYAQPRDRERSAAAGFDVHLVKPVNAATITTVIDRVGAEPVA